MRGSTLAALLSFTLGASALPAQFVWTGLGPDGDALDDLNWQDGAPAGLGSESLRFADFWGNMSVVELPVASAFNHITFEGAVDLSVKFSAGNAASATLTLLGDVIAGPNYQVELAPAVTLELGEGAHRLLADSGSIFTIKGGITGPGSLIKEASGVLELLGVNTYTGGTLVRKGVLSLLGGTIEHPDADLVVGQLPDLYAELSVEQGATLTTRNTVIGQDAGSTGDVRIQDEGTTWTNTGTLIIGEGGDGYLQLADGAVVTSGATTIGRQTSSYGGAEVWSGAHWTIQSDLIIGGDGDGYLEIENATVSTNGDTYIGHAPGSWGDAFLYGGSWTIAGDLFIGYHGDGSLEIESGSSVTNGSTVIGSGSPGSSWGDAYIWESTWTMSGGLTVGSTSTGYLTNESGSVFAASLDVGVSTGAYGYVDVENADGLLEIDGAARIGIDGYGDLYIDDGAHFSAGSSVLGVNTSGRAWASVSDAASIWTTTALTIAQSGEAHVHLQDGATLRVTELPIMLAQAEGSTGTLTLSTSDYGAFPILDAPGVTTGAGTGELWFSTNGSDSNPFYFTRDGTANGAPVVIGGNTQLYNQDGVSYVFGHNPYTGGTDVVRGTLVGVGDTTLDRPFGDGTITVGYSGTIAAAASTYIHNPLVLEFGSRVAGVGTFADATVAGGATLAPGMAPHLTGDLHFHDLTLGAGGFFDIDVRFNGESFTNDHVIVSSPATLHLEADAVSPFTFRLISLSEEGVAGSLVDLSLNATYQLHLFSTNGIEGDLVLGENLWIDASQFSTGFPDVHFQLVRDGNDLFLNFTPVPEPSTYALMALGLGALGLAARRRRS